MGRSMNLPTPEKSTICVVPGLDFRGRHAHREAAEHHVPLAGEVVEQRGVHAEQRGLAGRVDGALLGGQQSGDGPQQRGLARSRSGR